METCGLGTDAVHSVEVFADRFVPGKVVAVGSTDKTMVVRICLDLELLPSRYVLS